MRFMQVPSERDAGYRVIRLCASVTAAVCVVYGSYRAVRSSAEQASASAQESPRLVILGKEDEETVALIAEDIQQSDGSVMSLDDFLGKLICGACSRKCPLLSPRCRRGMAKAETQTGYYEEAVELLQSEQSGAVVGDVQVEW